MSGTDLPPPYYALKEDASTEQKATEVTISDSHATESAGMYGILFEHEDIRIGFIQKVLIIKMLQTLAMTIILAIFAGDPYSIHMLLHHSNNIMRVTATLVLVGMLVLIHYCDKARFARPYNYMFLLTYPLSVAFFIGVVTNRWGLAEILTSWIPFNFVVFGLLVYSISALQTKIEFKTSTGVFFAAVFLIVAYLVTLLIIYDCPISLFGVFYCSLGMFALTVYMLYDIQAMMSKTYRIQLSPSDFVKAALIMHIDYRYIIWNLFSKKPETYDNSDIDAAFNVSG